MLLHRQRLQRILEDLPFSDWLVLYLIARNIDRYSIQLYLKEGKKKPDIFWSPIASALPLSITIGDKVIKKKDFIINIFLFQTHLAPLISLPALIIQLLDNESKSN